VDIQISYLALPRRIGLHRRSAVYGDDSDRAEKRAGAPDSHRVPSVQEMQILSEWLGSEDGLVSKYRIIMCCYGTGSREKCVFSG
jgi:hypothetical protein